MKQSPTRALYAGALGLILLGGAGGALVATPAAASRVAPTQAVIVTIDLERMFAGLEERMAREVELKGYGERLQKELDRMVQQATEEKGKADLLPDGPDKRAALEKALETQVNTRVKKEFYDALLERRRGETFQSLYRKISAAAKRMAEQNGYTMVIASDESVQIPANAPTGEIQRVISLKRLVYAGPGHDVTDQLITLMNNEFKTAGAAAPAKP